MNAWIRRQVLRMEAYADRPWYPFLIGLLAGLDNLIVVVPTDGILISSILLQPKRWLRMSFAITLGSSLGGLVLAWLVQHHGLPLIETYYPSLLTTKSWVWTEYLFDNYGLIVLFAVAATPIMQHPAIVLTALSGTSLLSLFMVMIAGRALKYLFLGYISAKMPALLGRLWGVRKELEEVGIEAKPNEIPDPPTVLR
ncbi:MAG: hypothetical protein KF767_15885 [Bdellovibrionaceae bacterium]|nr:hypothetical protein [Pseudobdellovibrionaceae bacterium]